MQLKRLFGIIIFIVISQVRITMQYPTLHNIFKDNEFIDPNENVNQDLANILGIVQDKSQSVRKSPEEERLNNELNNFPIQQNLVFDDLAPKFPEVPGCEPIPSTECPPITIPPPATSVASQVAPQGASPGVTPPVTPANPGATPAVTPPPNPTTTTCAKPYITTPTTKCVTVCRDASGTRIYQQPMDVQLPNGQRIPLATLDSESETKTKELRCLVQHLYVAQARVQLEATEIRKAQAVATSAQYQLEDASNHVRSITATLHNAQQELAAAAIRAQIAQLQLAAHDQLLFAARQDVDALSSRMVGLQAAEGIVQPRMNVNLEILLEKLGQPLADYEKPTPIPSIVSTPMDIMQQVTPNVIDI